MVEKEMIHKKIFEKMKRKALKSACRYKISAAGFNKKGECVIITHNKHKFPSKEPRYGRISGYGIHAEEEIFPHVLKKNIKTIIIMRVNRHGNLLPIDPCDSCKKTSEKLGVNIISIFPGEKSETFNEDD